MTGLVTLAVPCRSDEPALGRTLAAALASWGQAPASATHGLEVMVCLNGAEGPRPRADLLAFAREASVPLAEVDLDRADGAAPAPPSPLGVTALVTRRAGKPLAWNALRRCARGPLALFVDADVSFAADAFALLLGALEANPLAALASAKTTCAPRPGLFEGIMAAPYGVDFPNLSPQLYAARVAALPPAMPEDLIEPERWLELMLGCHRIIRVPAARVAVRLPGTRPDFFRQRIRIEMGKLQLARQYPELAARGAPQPRGRAALASLGPGALARLAAYLGLRSAAHAVAWWRWRRGATAGIWRQAATTKRWDPA
ncbi:MAG TPA: glycosyltransferase family A protein [Verrucomicrobiae bacterium]|nr:glycosyltransferase family A protein [Verrucomicrobiae bacterium]